MNDLMDIINIIGILGTALISAVTLFTTRSLQRSQQQATIMATKRSERIDHMRQCSADFISCGKHILYGIGGAETKAALICHGENLISLLQYAYPHDVEWIDCIKDIVNICMEKEPDKERLENKLWMAWRICDIYVGVEYERLKNESKGDINGSGNVNKESKTFEDLYKDLFAMQEKFLPKEPVK